MSETAYSMNCKVQGPARYLGLDTAANLPAALREQSEAYTQAAERASKIADYLESHPPIEYCGIVVTLADVPPADLFTPEPGFLLPSDVKRICQVAVDHLGDEVEHTIFAPISEKMLECGFQQIEGGGLHVESLVLSARDYADLRKFVRNILNDETQVSRLRLGVMGSIWGAHLLISREIPQGKLVLLSQEARTGSVPSKGVVVMNVTR